MSKKRKQGEGTLRKRADGRWEARVVVGYDDKGLPITKNVTAMEKGKCLEKLEQLKEKCGVQLTGKVKADMEFGDWIDFWYQQYAKQKLRPTSQSGYENYIYKHVIPDIGKIPLNKLTQNDLQQFYTRLKVSGRKIRTELYGNGVSDRVVRGCHAMCRKALEKAVADGLIRTNPAIGCKLPPKKTKEMQVLTKEEMQRFMLQAKADGYFELFILELGTGMRRGELLGLQWDDLNMQTGELHICRQATTVNGNIHICAPKTKSSIRTVILPPNIVKMLAEYKKGIRSRWLFPSPLKEDAPRHPSSVRKVLERTLERAECKHIRFHDLRHTFATNALAGGMDVKTLSAIIGHISAETTLNIYTHITDNMQRSAANKIEQGFGRNEGALGGDGQTPDQPIKTPQTAKFEPKKPKIRRPGTGCITEINDHLFEGRYSPTDAHGKRTPKNIYAKTREECEEKLAELIVQMNVEIAAEKERMKSGQTA